MWLLQGRVCAVCLLRVEADAYETVKMRESQKDSLDAVIAVHPGCADVRGGGSLDAARKRLGLTGHDVSRRLSTLTEGAAGYLKSRAARLAKAGDGDPRPNSDRPPKHPSPVREERRVVVAEGGGLPPVSPEFSGPDPEPSDVTAGAYGAAPTEADALGRADTDDDDLDVGDLFDDEATEDEPW